jgi:hypothetical protein
MEKKNYKEITSFEFMYGGFFQGHNRLSVISGFDDKGTATWSISTHEIYDDSRKIFGDLTAERWDEVRRALVEKANVLSWNESYVESFIMDGFQWELEINFSDGTKLEISGSNDYPKEWIEFNFILSEMTGLKEEFDTDEDESEVFGDEDEELEDTNFNEFHDKED